MQEVYYNHYKIKETTMTITIETSEVLAAQVAANAARDGMSIEQYTLRALRLSQFAFPPLTFEQFMQLPAEERDRHLALQAEDAADLYEDDLAKPVSERELTEFTALDGDPVHEIYPDEPRERI